MNKVRMISIILILAMTFSFANVSPVTAQEATPPEPPGWTRGTGTHFELLDSPYLPVTLDSSVTVTLILSSVPEIVDVTIVPDAAAGSAEFTLGGFTPNTLYYHYVDEGLNPVTFTTDDTGSFTFTQDLSEGHHVWFRTQPSTKFLYDNPTGGDCTTIGSWSSATKTCTLTGNVNEPIFIQGNGITLDGAGKQVSAPGNYAVYSSGFSNVTIKNVNAISAQGIWAIQGSNLTVTNNTVSGGYYGIITYSGNNVSITDNTVTASTYAVYNENYANGNVTIDQNTISGGSGYYSGIWLYNTSSGVVAVTNNTISGFSYGILAYYPNNWTMRNNTISNSQIGLFLINSGPASVYNNNFINNLTQIGNSGSASFNQAAPVGGNYFSDFNTPGQGCNDINSDGFCDMPYYFSGGQDNLPWTTQDGWVTPADSVAPTASPTQSPAANGAGWNNSDVTVTWNWSDEAGGSGIDNANCTIDSTSTGEDDPITLNATCKDLAGNEGNASYMVKVDQTLPTVSLVDGPADGGSYYFGSVPAAPTCSASDALSGLDGSCTVSGYSALVGPQTVTASAEDMASNQNSASASYTVLAWTTNGFFQPVDMGGVWNTVKGGSTVPLKFKVFSGSTELTDPAIVNQPLKATQSLCSGGTADEIELVETGATSLRYDTTDGQFIYNWKTPKKPGYCYVVTITMADGSTISANFKLK